MSCTHDLKTIDLYFDAVERGEKTFEVRLNDRAFQTGDLLILRRYEIDHWSKRPFPSVPSRTIKKRITYLLQGGQFGIDARYCVLGLGEVQP